ncbi:hypothetical protein KIPE111705_23610 [Kibdelosporangium persicum]|uniref:RING-type E3 ubiquitin transferase n=1 Tax=Kibdelosporangium persicum TaxID=2698649 RepID=A0ABX2F3H6_9PSEU|nr:hypothetical protein [Kibdelosporangium persicum]NRN65797.1 hypothetical protein [Kibdelosporangium persicum]
MATADHKPQQNVEDITRELLVAAYPEKDSSWIDEQATAAGQRITRAKQGQPSTAAAARRLSDTVVNRSAPRSTRPSQVPIGIGLAAVGVLAMVLGTTELQWVAETTNSTAGIGVLLAVTAVASLGTITSYARSRRERILSCRVRIDAPFGSELGETVRLEGERATVVDPGVVVVRVKNTGGTPIQPEDYISPLSLRFPGRKVFSVGATEFEPPELQRVLNALPGFTIEQDRVRLPMIGPDQGDSFKLMIVLSGTKAGKKHQVVVEGGLRDGRITTRAGKEKIRPDTLVWGGLTAICAGALAVVLLFNNVTPFIRLP